LRAAADPPEDAAVAPHAELVCFEGCPGERYPITDVVYRCRRCGALLDVAHDLEALAAEADGPGWRARFEAPPADGRPPSGVWRHQPWVVPGLPPEAIVSFGEGDSPLWPARRHGAAIGLPELWIKQCGTSHSGSFKDLGMTVLVSVVQHMIRQGTPIRGIACASTGDTSAALAAYCAAADIPAVVLLPRAKISTAQLLQPLAHGARVLSLDTDFDGCMVRVQELAESGLVYLANSMNALRLEGQKTVGLELLRQLPRRADGGWAVPDWIVIPGGNLGNVYALWRGLDMARTLGLIDRLPRLAVAQAAHASPLHRAFVEGFERYAPVTARRTAASAIQIGDPVSIHRAIRALRATDGVVEAASEDELADAVARADRTGLYACPHTGVALAAAEKLRAAGTIREDERVVVISTAHGLKFTEFKQAYHEDRLPEAEARHANRPIELPNERAAIEAAILAG
jgi:threonine synthase